jgi:hypothetical protein
MSLIKNFVEFIKSSFFVKFFSQLKEIINYIVESTNNVVLSIKNFFFKEEKENNELYEMKIVWT